MVNEIVFKRQQIIWNLNKKCQNIICIECGRMFHLNTCIQSVILSDNGFGCGICMFCNRIKPVSERIKKFMKDRGLKESSVSRSTIRKKLGIAE